MGQKNEELLRTGDLEVHGEMASSNHDMIILSLVDIIKLRSRLSADRGFRN